MTPEAAQQPLPPDEFLEDAIIVASLAHYAAKTPEQRRIAWDRLAKLNQRRAELKARAAA